MLRIRHFAALAIVAVAPVMVAAQDTVTLRPVSVSATRSGSRTPLELPFALSRISPDTTRPGLRKLSVGELLLGVPGVQVQDRANPAQDPRLSIRGFGSRSAFGVRGVRVLRDGIPLSLPDGQTPLDWLDLESIGEVEVIRGTAAALFGNAAGGVVAFRTREPAPSPLSIGARAWHGAGLTRMSATATSAGRALGALQQPTLLASVTRTSGDGAREWAEQEITSLFARSTAHVAGIDMEVQGTWYDNPRALNTGALTAVELQTNPRLPDPLSVSKHSRKAVDQKQVAFTARRVQRKHELEASLFTSTRSLENPLPFSIIGVERRATGGALRAGTRFDAAPVATALRLAAGVDAQWQRDDRANWENCVGVPAEDVPSSECPVAGAARGSLRLDQREDVDGVGSYARAELEFPGGVFVSGALRYDRVRFEVRDRFVNAENGDDSGIRSMTATSPMAGVVWRVRPLVSLYANWSNAFETPTITELTNQPDGSAGLNAVIQPQRTSTVEAGVQGFLGTAFLGDLSLFDARVTDELVSFDVPNAPGRRAFRNAGRTSRRGVEASGRVFVAAGEVGAAYTWSRFRFLEYVVGNNDFAGNKIPGIPEHMLQAFYTARWRNVFGTLETRMASEVSANDAGTVTSAGYAVWNARGGYAPRIGASRIEFILGVENIFDQRYATSVVTNATRGRFYEPGLHRSVYLSASLGWR